MDKNFPEGKYMATVKIGPKGQIVIPKEVREMFGFQAGDSVLLLADKNQGVAIQPFAYAEAFWNAVSQVKEGEEK
ncbi:MAG: AbrB/MazE/SpoVT family DNA-binding domain-containing protein [Clostridiales bacterium]|nr:AbrB/MazE/SpoVT family DNA-binding domain-containing protein [Clostridiales bacterium]